MGEKNTKRNTSPIEKILNTFHRENRVKMSKTVAVAAPTNENLPKENVQKEIKNLIQTSHEILTKNPEVKPSTYIFNEMEAKYNADLSKSKILETKNSHPMYKLMQK